MKTKPKRRSATGGAANFRKRGLKAYLIGIPQADVESLIAAARAENRSVSGFIVFHSLKRVKDLKS